MECARVEFEDEETVPVLHYVHEDKEEENLDPSISNDEKNSKKRRRSSKRDKRSKNFQNKVDSYPIPETSGPKVEFKTDLQNCQRPTISEHVPAPQKSDTFASSYPEEYTENVFLEATLSYVPPTDDETGALKKESFDKEVQTSFVQTKCDEQNLDDEKISKEVDINADAGKEEETSEIDENGDLESEKSQKEDTSQIMNDEEVNDILESSAQEDPKKIDSTDLPTEPSPKRLVETFSCNNADYTTTKDIGLANNEINHSEHWTDSDYSGSSRMSTPRHKFTGSKSKIAPIEVKGKVSIICY